MAKRSPNCIFLFPAALTGLGRDTCRLFGECVERMGIVHRCAGRTAHTKASRQALADAIEIVKARGGKYPVDTEHGDVI